MMTNPTLYHIAHICGCGQFISHSQGDFDSHKFHAGTMTTISPLQTRISDAIAYGEKVEDFASDDRNPANRGVLLCYGYGYLIGRMMESVTPHEKHSLNRLYDLLNNPCFAHRKWRTQDLFESYAWQIRTRLEAVNLF